MSEEIILEESLIVLAVPTDSVALTIKATVLLDGALQEVEKTLTLREIRRAFQDAEENYDDPDVSYDITEKGREYLEEKRRGSDD